MSSALAGFGMLAGAVLAGKKLTEEDIDRTIKRFPSTFGMRAFPGKIFKINRFNSYIAGDKIMLYTDIKLNGGWGAFAKGTPEELKREIVKL